MASCVMPLLRGGRHRSSAVDAIASRRAKRRCARVGGSRRAKGRCLGRRLRGCEPMAASSPRSSTPRRGWGASSRAPRLSSAASAVEGRLVAKHNAEADGHGAPRGAPSGRGPLRAPRWEPRTTLGKRRAMGVRAGHRRGRVLGGLAPRPRRLVSVAGGEVGGSGVPVQRGAEARRSRCLRRSHP